jgi:hypothetical protein
LFSVANPQHFAMEASVIQTLSDDEIEKVFEALRSARTGSQMAPPLAIDISEERVVQIHNKILITRTTNALPPEGAD